MGRKQIRVAVRPLKALFVPKPTQSLDEARADLGRAMATWPNLRPRLAIRAGTGVGKTTLAVRKCAEHVMGRLGLGSGALLFVAHNKARVGELLVLIRDEVGKVGGDEAQVRELLGRQRLDPDDDSSGTGKRFGCTNYDEAQRHGKRGRNVLREVCNAPCPHKLDCRFDGYLRHVEEAEGARVIVTTVQRLPSLRAGLWKRIDAVICDEDVMPGLMSETRVYRRDLRRARRYLRRALKGDEGVAAGNRVRKYHGAATILIHAICDILRKRPPRRAVPLVQVLPESCDELLTAEGLARLRRAMPVRFEQGLLRKRAIPSVHRPAPWEQRTGARIPRQVWGRLLDAFLVDAEVPDAETAAIVRIERRPRKRREAMLSVQSFHGEAVKRLRSRPLLVLDATMHPAADAVLSLERVDIDYDQGRTILQVLTTLHHMPSLAYRHAASLTPLARRAVARIAAYARGRKLFVLCRKALKPLIERESTRFAELRHLDVVTLRNERGWNAPPDTDVFVVLGRYARPEESCAREAQALRSLVWRLDESTTVLDQLPTPGKWKVFQGRGQPVLHHGEPVERKSRIPDDPLAALIQDEDRIASVVQFIGRNRTGRSFVLLLRGDPTIPVDALVDADDMAEALPTHPELPESIAADEAFKVRPLGKQARRRVLRALDPLGPETIL